MPSLNKLKKKSHTSNMKTMADFGGEICLKVLLSISTESSRLPESSASKPLWCGKENGMRALLMSTNGEKPALHFLMKTE